MLNGRGLLHDNTTSNFVKVCFKLYLVKLLPRHLVQEDQLAIRDDDDMVLRDVQLHSSEERKLLPAKIFLTQEPE